METIGNLLHGLYTIHNLLYSQYPREGNGNPLQYSGLENPTEGGA